MVKGNRLGNSLLSKCNLRHGKRADRRRFGCLVSLWNPDQHEPVILEALRHGNNVLVEKPMVTSSIANEIAARTEHSSGKVHGRARLAFLHLLVHRERLGRLVRSASWRASRIRFRRQNLAARRNHIRNIHLTPAAFHPFSICQYKHISICSVTQRARLQCHGHGA